jgi:hypothetical protein
MWRLWPRKIRVSRRTWGICTGRRLTKWQESHYPSSSPDGLLRVRSTTITHDWCRSLKHFPLNCFLRRPGIWLVKLKADERPVNYTEPLLDALLFGEVYAGLHLDTSVYATVSRMTTHGSSMRLRLAVGDALMSTRLARTICLACFAFPLRKDNAWERELGTTSTAQAV